MQTNTNTDTNTTCLKMLTNGNQPTYLEVAANVHLDGTGPTSSSHCKRLCDPDFMTFGKISVILIP